MGVCAGAGRTGCAKYPAGRADGAHRPAAGRVPTHSADRVGAGARISGRSAGRDGDAAGPGDPMRGDGERAE